MICSVLTMVQFWASFNLVQTFDSSSDYTKICIKSRASPDTESIATSGNMQCVKREHSICNLMVMCHFVLNKA